MAKEADYALYDGDRFVDLGTKKYLAAKMGIAVATVEFYASPSHKKSNPNGLGVYRIED